MAKKAQSTHRSMDLIRLSGLAAVAGGVFIVLARVLQVIIFRDAPLSVQAASPDFLPALGIPGLLGSLGFLVGLIGLYARQAVQGGRLGLATFVIAMSGVALSLGANWGYAFMAPFLAEHTPAILDLDFSDPRWGLLGAGFAFSYLAGGIGWLLMGLLTWQTRVLPRWVPVLILASILLPAFLPVELHGAGGILVNLALAAGPIGVGIALWNTPRLPSSAPPSVR